MENRPHKDQLSHEALNLEFDCAFCNNSVWVGETTFDGHQVCYDCADTYVKCHDCGDWVNDYEDFESDHYCEECYHDKFSRCCECEVVDYADNMVYMESDDSIYCDHCVSNNFCECDDCGEWHPLDHIISDTYGHTGVCERCFEDNGWNICCECNALIDQFSSQWSERTDDVYCQGCYREVGGSRYIFPYHTPESERITPFQFNGSTARGLFFGVELEVEHPDPTCWEDLAEFATDDLGFHCEEDGSVRGFEIISNPFSWTYYESDQKELFNDLLTAAQSQGFKSYDSGNCGIHIHLSKKAFSTQRLLNFLTFMYSNLEYINCISQRDYTNGSCSWHMSKECKDSITPERLKVKAERKTDRERYTAVNLSNPDTIEVRIFRGTLNKESFFKNLEFVKALYEFCGFVDLTETTLKENAVLYFHDYIEANSEKYSNLYSFLKKKGFYSLNN